MLNRLSMRVSLVVTVVAMGALGLGLAAISGRIYRNHAVDNERTALVDQLRVRLHDVSQGFDREAETLARTLRDRSRAHAVALQNPEQLQPVLKQMLDSHSHATGPVALAVHDRAGARLVAGVHAQGNGAVASDWQTACAHVRQLIPARAGDGQVRSVAGNCYADGRLYYSTFVPIGEPVVGQLQVIFDLLPSIMEAEDAMALPLQVSLGDGRLIYESARWPGAGDSGQTLVAVHPIKIALPASTIVLFHVAKDESVFYAKLEKTRYAVFVLAVAITLFFVLIALGLLERTTIAPISVLTEQLRRVRHDESQLGKRVQVSGNAEVIELAKGFNEMTTRLEGLYENLERMAYTDPLTQLPNRSLFQRRLSETITRAQHENKAFALFIMDLDRFKEINDTLGHHIGDLLLQQVAVRLRGKLRESDTLARMGGDEFAVLLPAVTSKQADMAARMLCQALRAPFMVEANNLHVRVSIGVALYPDHGVDVNTLVQRADVAMYAAKAVGCGHAFYDTEMDRHHPARLTLMGELRQAVEQEQFELYFQPKIGLHSDRVVGVEALVRWRHPSGRLIMPDTFIPLLEQTGLIRSLTLWVVNESLRTGSELRSQGFHIPIAVNISIRDLQDGNLIEELAEQLAAHHAAADWIELELTESAVMADVGGALDVLSRLAAMGFCIVLDDFGTGYSSLAYLKRLPVRMVKVDKSFVMGMNHDENDAAIVYTSIALAHNLGLQVVAEGVDDPRSLERLRARGCDAVQGIYLSRPLGREELIDWLNKSRWGLPRDIAS
jgi:diguanylate cyclase